MIPVALIIFCLIPVVQNEYFRPTYQVLLRKRNNFGALVDGHCYGNILQSRLVLTAASCLFTTNKTSNGRKYLKSDELAVSFQGEDLNEFIYFVSGIDIYPEFAALTFANDIAILSLSAQFPLSERNDIQWISLADYDIKDLPLEDGKETYVWKNSNGLSPYPGYGVVHESNLVGIASFGIPSKNKRESNLESRSLNKITQLNLYLSWIYEILQNAEIADMQNNNYSVSLPYHQRKSAEIGNLMNFFEPDAVYFPDPENSNKDYIDTEVEDLTNVANTYAENVETDAVQDFTKATDISKKNIESETGFLTNEANMLNTNLTFSWILILHLIYVKYRMLSFLFS
ncbi:LOW QUALITY PROTEIN: uncharacterized protein LOC108110796 [Drosophila eugracilis]|uniref:LOW QUALITY PROTEIN: uncharacterized protein LOC108110796 n=1 Tax=Drosophila eugracilis TaxID=29029 RepID=UPI001BDB0A33|nr:LOW QUALITY PROTEIN: uncharacterized protein LOC108110796 [Drosophila eugracilis]